MFPFRETFASRTSARFILAGLVSTVLAGCSSDAARFAGLPSPAPGQVASQEVTGSLGAAPTGRVDSAPISGTQALGAAPAGPPTAYASAPTPAYERPLYNPSSPPPTAARQPATVATHVVASGETLATLARSYGMTAADFAKVNGLAPDATLRVGQTLIVPPGAVGNLAHMRVPATPAKPSAVTVPATVVAKVKSAEKQAVVAAVSAATPVAAAPALAPAVAAVSTPTLSAAPASAPAAAAPVAAAVKTAAVPAKVAADETDDGARAAGSGPQFRAPVRGRVISGFGPKPGGTRNDGVNFAVPEGTSVRAAEDGTVAYAGNELKGYGNLVLIKHADGYVTAYAYNSELMVKKGDAVRRGQVISKAGQTGGVTSPQLHFEIRKGSQPVDPSKYVAGL